MITVSTLEWSGYQDGWLAQAKPGYLFILSRFDSEIGFERWFVLYCDGPHFYREQQIAWRPARLQFAQRGEIRGRAKT
jgi:hypothetical protein